MKKSINLFWGVVALVVAIAPSLQAADTFRHQVRSKPPLNATRQVEAFVARENCLNEADDSYRECTNPPEFPRFCADVHLKMSANCYGHERVSEMSCNETGAATERRCLLDGNTDDYCSQLGFIIADWCKWSRVSYKDPFTEHTERVLRVFR